MVRCRTHSPRAFLSALALTGALLSGCGSTSSSGNGVASKSPAQIVEAAKAAVAGAASAHVTGSIVDEGKPITLDMELLAGRGGKGRISLEGLSVELIDVNDSIYINGSEAFYRHVAGPAAAKLLQGKWLKASATSGSFASLASLTSLDKLIDTTLAAHGALARAGSKTIGGRPAVGVTDRSRDGTLYVASTGTAFPLQISKAGASGGTIEFDRWNGPVTLTAPANAVNIHAFQSGR